MSGSSLNTWRSSSSMRASYAATSSCRLLSFSSSFHLQLEVLGQEEGDGGAVNAVGATQRRHHQERSFPRGVPHRAVTPLRPGNLRQRCRPLPPEVESSVPRRA